MRHPEDRGEAGRYERERERQAPSRRVLAGEVEIVVAGSAGYCYGVERALQIAEEAAGAAKPIYTLGPIIHNPSVVRRLEERGIVPVDSLDAIVEGTVIVRTHGVPPEVIAAASSRLARRRRHVSVRDDRTTQGGDLACRRLRRHHPRRTRPS